MFIHRLLATFTLVILSISACQPVPLASSPGSTAEAIATPGWQSGDPTPTHKPGCTIQTRRPTPNPTVESLLPPLNEEDWTKGEKQAFVTIVEYGDFQ